MKLTLMTLLFVVVVMVPPVIAQEKASSTTTETGLGRWVRVEASKAPVAEVWRIFTTSEGAEEFFFLRRRRTFGWQSEDPMRSSLIPRTSSRGPRV